MIICQIIILIVSYLTVCRVVSMKSISTIAVILALLMQGCLASVDSDDGIWSYEEDYPRLELSEKSRSSAVVQNFNDCDTLLQTLQQNLLDEMAVRLDRILLVLADLMLRFGGSGSTMLWRKEQIPPNSTPEHLLLEKASIQEPITKNLVWTRRIF